MTTCVWSCDFERLESRGQIRKAFTYKGNGKNYIQIPRWICLKRKIGQRINTLILPRLRTLKGNDMSPVYAKMNSTIFLQKPIDKCKYNGLNGQHSMNSSSDSKY